METQEKAIQFKTKDFWLHLWSLLASVQGKIKKLALLMVIVEVVKLIGPYLLKLLIDSLNTGLDNIGKILIIIAAIFLTYQIQSIIAYFLDNLIFRVLMLSDQDLIMNAFRKMIHLHLGFHEKENTGNKVGKIDRGVGKIDELISAMGWEVGPTLIQIFLTLPVLFFVNWMFGLVVVCFMPIFVAMTLRLNHLNFPMRMKRHDYYEDVTGRMIQSIININTVKSFVQEDRELERLKKSLDEGHAIHFAEFANQTRFNVGRNLIIDSGRGLILLSGLFLTYKGMLTIGGLIFVYTISEKALLSLFRITRLYDKIMDSSEAVERLYELDKEKIEIKSPSKGIIAKNVQGKLEFESVSFTYNKGGDPALDNVTAEILPGSTVAIVGPSGGGKTTFVRMIYRHYDPTGGAVLLDGVDLRKYKLESFRKHMAIVPQEVEIFNMSVSENIAYAKPNASAQEVRAAARIANAEEFIKNINGGYDALVGERGIKLSGGQRQRIGIARAILANPKVLIFDEATSSLDSQSEKLIQEAMDRIRKNRTVIIIAHRLSTIRKADKIIVLEKGAVVEVGSHVELAAKQRGLYKKLLDLQRMGDVD
jgi:ABC-type multidrug transport system fused ATPase/permease subunit